LILDTGAEFVVAACDDVKKDGDNIF